MLEFLELAFDMIKVNFSLLQHLCTTYVLLHLHVQKLKEKITFPA